MRTILEEQHSKQELFNDEAEVVHINPSLKLRVVKDKDVEDIARKRISDLLRKRISDLLRKRISDLLR